MKAGTNLEKVLKSGAFAVTAEVGPPQGAVPDEIRSKGETLKPYCDAMNVTDNQSAVVKMSSWSSSVILKEMGIDPVMQIVVRDRNRLAIQSDVLGAVALGIRNFLCLSGDHPSLGNHPEAKGVYDLDSIQLIQTLKGMRDEGKFQCGEEISGEVSAFIGAAANPFAAPFELRPHRLAKKVKAGADFIQTQMIFNVPRFKEFMKQVKDMGLHEKVYILAGVGPIRSLGAAKYMATKVPGMDVPEEIIERIRKTPRKNRAKEGIRICVEIIQQIREIEGVSGVHIMAIEWEEAVPEIVERAGLMPRP